MSDWFNTKRTEARRKANANPCHSAIGLSGQGLSGEAFKTILTEMDMDLFKVAKVERPIMNYSSRVANDYLKTKKHTEEEAKQLAAEVHLKTKIFLQDTAEHANSIMDKDVDDVLSRVNKPNPGAITYDDIERYKRQGLNYSKMFTSLNTGAAESVALDKIGKKTIKDILYKKAIQKVNPSYKDKIIRDSMGRLVMVKTVKTEDGEVIQRVPLMKAAIDSGNTISKDDDIDNIILTSNIKIDRKRALGGLYGDQEVDTELFMAQSRLEIARVAEELETMVGFKVDEVKSDEVLIEEALEKEKYNIHAMEEEGGSPSIIQEEEEGDNEKTLLEMEAEFGEVNEGKSEAIMNEEDGQVINIEDPSDELYLRKVKKGENIQSPINPILKNEIKPNIIQHVIEIDCEKDVELPSVSQQKDEFDNLTEFSYVSDLKREPKVIKRTNATKEAIESSKKVVGKRQKTEEGVEENAKKMTRKEEKMAKKTEIAATKLMTNKQNVDVVDINDEKYLEKQLEVELSKDHPNDELSETPISKKDVIFDDEKTRKVKETTESINRLTGEIKKISEKCRDMSEVELFDEDSADKIEELKTLIKNIQWPDDGVVKTVYTWLVKCVKDALREKKGDASKLSNLHKVNVKLIDLYEHHGMKNYLMKLIVVDSDDFVSLFPFFKDDKTQPMSKESVSKEKSQMLRQPKINEEKKKNPLIEDPKSIAKVDEKVLGNIIESNKRLLKSDDIEELKPNKKIKTEVEEPKKRKRSKEEEVEKEDERLARIRSISHYCRQCHNPVTTVSLSNNVGGGYDNVSYDLKGCNIKDDEKILVKIKGFFCGKYGAIDQEKKKDKKGKLDNGEKKWNSKCLKGFARASIIDLLYHNYIEEVAIDGNGDITSNPDDMILFYYNVIGRSKISWMDIKVMSENRLGEYSERINYILKRMDEGYWILNDRNPNL